MFKLTCDLTFPSSSKRRITNPLTRHKIALVISMDETKNTRRTSNLDIAETHDYSQHTKLKRLPPHKAKIQTTPTSNKQQTKNHSQRFHEPARSLHHEIMQAMPTPAVAKRNPIKSDRSRNQGFETAPILPLQTSLCDPWEHWIQLQNSTHNRFSQCSGSSSGDLRLEVQRSPDGDREWQICAGQEEQCKHDESKKDYTREQEVGRYLVR